MSDMYVRNVLQTERSFLPFRGCWCCWNTFLPLTPFVPLCKPLPPFVKVKLCDGICLGGCGVTGMLAHYGKVSNPMDGDVKKKKKGKKETKTHTHTRTSKNKKKMRKKGMKSLVSCVSWRSCFMLEAVCKSLNIVPKEKQAQWENNYLKQNRLLY